MQRLLIEMGILVPLLAFEIWNVTTAKKRGSIFLKLRPIDQRVEPKDFKMAIVLNLVFVVIISTMLVLRVFSFVRAS